MISVYMFCPIFMPSVGSRCFGFDKSRFFGFTVSDFSAMSIKLIAAIDTSSRPPENTPNSSLHLHYSVKTRTESFTFQLPVPGANAEIPVGTVEGVRGWGGGGGWVAAPKVWQSPALHYTLYNLHHYTFYNPFIARHALSLALYTLTTHRSRYSVIFGTGGCYFTVKVGVTVIIWSLKFQDPKCAYCSVWKFWVGNIIWCLIFLFSQKLIILSLKLLGGQSYFGWLFGAIRPWCSFKHQVSCYVRAV